MNFKNRIRKKRNAILTRRRNAAASMLLSCVFVGMVWVGRPLEMSEESACIEESCASLEINNSASVKEHAHIVVQKSSEEPTIKQSKVEEEITTNVEATTNLEPIVKEEEKEKETTKEETTTYKKEEASKDESPTKKKQYVSDETLLLRIASCEAGDQGVVGMAYVIKVVLNRVESSEFPNNIHDVIYEKKQFAAIHTHWWDEEYIAKGAREALELVYNGWDETEGALFFCMPSHNSYHSSALQYIKTYKDHEFYK